MAHKFSENSRKVYDRVPVFIAGGGISGLTAALCLLQHGITPLLVERHSSTSVHPRARGFDVRTMEIYRELQLSEPIREAGKALSPSWGIHTSSSLAEALRKKKPLEKKAIAFPIQMKGMEGLFLQSPEIGARCTQDLSEPILLAAAMDRGADIRFYHELLSFTQNADGVSALIRDRQTGEEYTVIADYMIAADGAKSRIREALQAPVTGKGILGDLFNIYFEAELGDFVRNREFSIIRIHQPEITGLLTAINNTDRWVFHLRYDAAKGESLADYPESRIIAILQKIIGLPEVKVRVISVLPWQPMVKVVDNMQHERIFLTGDAAHVMTPFGGKGANSGVQDVHNLSWKLAAVLKGQASSALLRTYSMERQPVGLRYARLSGEMTDKNGLLRKLPINMIRAFVLVKTISALRLNKIFPRTAMFQLGGLFGLAEYQYASAAIVGSTARTGVFTKAGSLDGTPGTRMPHLVVEYKHEPISTLDLLGHGFVLFTGTGNAEWKKSAIHANYHLKIPIEVYSIGTTGDLYYDEKKLKTVLGITDSGAVLVRPDGFVAWRTAQGDQETARLEKVLGELLQVPAGGTLTGPV